MLSSQAFSFSFLQKGLGDEGPAVALHAVVEDITTWHRNNIPTYSLACFRSVCRHLFGIARCSASIRRLDRKGRQSKSKEDEWRRMHIVSKVCKADTHVLFCLCLLPRESPLSALDNQHQ